MIEKRPSQCQFDLNFESVFKTININGPFGSASDKIFYAQNAVLISTGIGVTPFASILQSIFYQLLSQLYYCENCGAVSLQDHVKVMYLRRVSSTIRIDFRFKIIKPGTCVQIRYRQD